MDSSPLPPPPPPQPSSQSPPPRTTVPEMDTLPLPPDGVLIAGEPSSALWDWGDLFDFTIGDELDIPISPAPEILPNSTDSQREEELAPFEAPSGSAKVRKRDPRLTCSNFLAGRIPCACPEMDEQLKEEEVTPGKKRARTARKTAPPIVRCQVVGCEADIRELKGYHRRHRVCLRCANASTVCIDGESKRYCQQCGKFHVLSDFDEGKRSCRRKLERHNNRRRRKAGGSKSPATSNGKESQVNTSSEDAACDNETSKETEYLNSEVAEGLVEREDVTLSTLPASENTHNDSFVSFVVSDDAHVDGVQDDSKNALSSVSCDNKSAYSSMCPTNRISFKLYDWNPAEFPRRLRLQIFQWLASMPVELEGYVRPGCTILTAFIAMPKFMWSELHEDPASSLYDILFAPQGMLSGKGRVYVYLDDKIFYVGKGVSSITKIEANMQAPRLHYVEPICFEAGRPMELFVCGSNLHQNKFRFLISFAGKYLAYDDCIAVPHQEVDGTPGCSPTHQLYRIYIAHTDPDKFGPAFVEVENESGLSNHLPILIGNGEVCSEMKRLQRKTFVCCPQRSQLPAAGSLSDACQCNLAGPAANSEFVSDIAWLLRQPASDDVCHHVSYSQIQRFDCLLSYLLQHECTAILTRILEYMELLINDPKLSLLNGNSDADMRTFRRNINCTRDILFRKLGRDVGRPLRAEYEPEGKPVLENYLPLAVPCAEQDLKVREDTKFGEVCNSTSEAIPFLDKQVVMNVNAVDLHPRKSCGQINATRLLSRRPLVVIAAAAVCIGMCMVVYHPHRVSELVVTIRRCLFDGS